MTRRIGFLVAAGCCIVIGSALGWASVSKGGLRGSQAAASNFEIFGFFMAYALSVARVYFEAIQREFYGLVLVQMGEWMCSATRRPRRPVRNWCASTLGLYIEARAVVLHRGYFRTCNKRLIRELVRKQHGKEIDVIGRFRHRQECCAIAT